MRDRRARAHRRRGFRERVGKVAPREIHNVRLIGVAAVDCAAAVSLDLPLCEAPVLLLCDHGISGETVGYALARDGIGRESYRFFHAVTEARVFAIGDGMRVCAHRYSVLAALEFVPDETVGVFVVTVVARHIVRLEYKRKLLTFRYTVLGHICGL